MITTYDKRRIQDFQDWVADCHNDGLGKEYTPEKWLEVYLDSIGDIIAGSGITLAKIVDDAKTGKFNPAYQQI